MHATYNTTWDESEGLDVLEACILATGDKDRHSTAMHLRNWAANAMHCSPEAEFDAFTAWLMSDENRAYAFQEGWPAALRRALVECEQA